MPLLENRRPCIVGVGGTLRRNSSTERAIEYALRIAEQAGATTVQLPGPELEMPMFAPERPERTTQARKLIAELRRADGIIIGSPGYHGSLSGLVKNAIDYTEDMRDDETPYLEGRAVGCIVTAAGWQAGGTTLATLRGIVHALRGWPTPLGVIINTAEPVFDAAGQCLQPRVEEQLECLALQVVKAARARRPAEASA